MKGTPINKNYKSAKHSFNFIKNFMIFIILFYHLSSICQTVTDIDNNKYTTIKIGDQIWMSQNLNVTHFKNGDIIPEVINQREWQEAWINKKPAWCNPNNINNLTSTYGKLYNWYAVADPRGLAPANYKIPNWFDWQKAIDYFGNSGFIGYKISGTGFDFPRAGNRDILTSFWKYGESSTWWSSTESNEKSAWCVLIGKEWGPRLYDKCGIFGNGFSVKCLLEK